MRRNPYEEDAPPPRPDSPMERGDSSPSQDNSSVLQADLSILQDDAPTSRPDSSAFPSTSPASLRSAPPASSDAIPALPDALPASSDAADAFNDADELPSSAPSTPAADAEKHGDGTPIYRTRIQDLPAEERPRERLWYYGAEALSSAELTAILLRTGSGKASALDVATHLLAKFGGVRGLAGASLEELAETPGVGEAKAAQIKAGLEIGKRFAGATDETRIRVGAPSEVHALLWPDLMTEKREHLVALLLNTRGYLIRRRTVAIGDLTSVIMTPREILAEAVRHGAAAILLAHNHPSGDPSPSPEDITVTRRVAEAARLMGIDLLDHVILGDGRWMSLREEGIF